MKRVEGVDSLRGLLACGVMVYHFFSWTRTSFYVFYHDVFEVLAVCFVETFFVISGFSLFYVYRNRLGTFSSIKRFFIRRFFRIAPLFYLLLVLVVVIKLAAIIIGIEVNRPIDFYLLVMNFTFLFGLVWPSDSLLVAGWSIGVEMALYLLFPFLLIFCRNIYLSMLLVILSVLMVFSFSHYYLNTSDSFSEQWGWYTFSLNHMHYFVSGFFIYFVFDRYQHYAISRALFWVLLTVLISIVSVFLFYSPGVEHSLIGVTRFGLFVACAGFVLLFALYNVSNKYLLQLGDLSYSIYLGHFFVYLVVSRVFEKNIFVVSFGVLGAIMFASLTYKYIEKPMIKIGKRFG